MTQRAIDALTPTPGAQYVRWDARRAGFGVRVSPAGAKTYVYKYRLKSGRVRWATIGRTDALTLDQARDRFDTMRGQVANGDDPLKVADGARGALTVGLMADRFLAHVEAHKKPATVRLYKLVIDGQIRPVLGAVPIGDIDQEEAIKLHHRLKATPTLANRTLAVLSSLMSWCQKARGDKPNPCIGIHRYPEKKRRRYLTEAEYARLGAALRTVPISPAPKTAIELLLLTGARPAEVASLQWQHVDLQRGVLDLPDSKTGAKVIHLPVEAVRLLRKWPRFGKSPYVFPGNGRKKSDHMHPSTLAHVWLDLRQAADLDDVRLYDACRHSYASVAVSRHGLSLAQIGEQLGHSQPATTARYAHLHDDVAHEQAGAVGKSIAAALRRKVRA